MLTVRSTSFGDSEIVLEHSVLKEQTVPAGFLLTSEIVSDGSTSSHVLPPHTSGKLILICITPVSPLQPRPASANAKRENGTPNAGCSPTDDAVLEGTSTSSSQPQRLPGGYDEERPAELI